MRIRAMKKQSQNKPNLLDAQMNISSVLTKDYENVPLCRRGENKPNQTQFQTQRTLCEFFLFFTFLCPSYNLADYEQTWFERGGQESRGVAFDMSCADLISGLVNIDR